MFIKRFKIWTDVLRCLFLTFWGVKADIKSAEETVDAIVSGKSLIRFGDGEFGIYRGNNIHYQDWSVELKSDFENIRKKFEIDKESCPYILAVPKYFMSINGLKLIKKRVYVSSWAQSRYDFKNNFNLSLSYGDSFLFEKKNKDVYSTIWKDKNCPPNVIFVHNNEVYAKHFSETYSKNTFFVKCPPQNAYSEIDRIENDILKIIKDKSWDKNDVMLTISAGPAGKMLVYRLCMSGYHCVDAGHCWDDPLES